MKGQQEVDDLLRKVLLLERQQNFGNRAMMGGLSRFAQELHKQATAGSGVPEVALLLVGYDSESAAGRARSVDKALTILAGDGTARMLDSEGTAEPYVSERSEVESQRSAPEHVNGAGHPGNGEVSAQDKRQTSSEADSSGAAVPPKVPAMRKKRVVNPAVPLPQLDMPVKSFRGVGDALGKVLNEAGVSTVRDLLFYFPREHLDFRRHDGIRSLRYGDRATIIGTVQSVRVQRMRAKLSVTKAIVGDDSGRIEVTWFNQPYLEKDLRAGRRIAISGEVSAFGDRLTFTPRDFEWVEDRDLTHGARLVPIYPLHKGMYQKSFRSLMRKVSSSMSSRLEDYLPAWVREDLGLLDQPLAISQYHFPDDADALSRSRKRLAFDELFSIRVGLQLRKRDWEESGGAPALTLNPEERQRFLSSLPFSLTNAQARVATEIERALACEKPMSRLVQGDVGSGKTVLAAYALYAAALHGFQGVIMAPTEMLARQHCASISHLLAPHGLSVALLTGSTKGKQRATILAAAVSGTIDVLAGTHALFQEGVEFRKLAVAVVDEQHRFGVQQRTRLRHKGGTPHLLAMTATPIPRTLALTVYGDLDISVLDELPPGRLPIETRLVATEARAYRFIEMEVEKGRQAFVVCPLIEESAESDTKSAVAEHRRLQDDVFPDLRIGLLHGKMTPRDKDAILKAFRAGEYHVLVSTTVIEVGIDIANATVMVIRDAHRFGLAQLHQLRGRVGRGGEASYCVLVSQASNGPTFERLMAVVKSNDGFKLAEEDLRLRGPGEFWGTRQSGLPQLRVAGSGDVDVIDLARKGADMVLERDGNLALSEHAGIRAQVERFWSQDAGFH